MMDKVLSESDDEMFQHALYERYLDGELDEDHPLLFDVPTPIRQKIDGIAAHEALERQSAHAAGAGAGAVTAAREKMLREILAAPSLENDELIEAPNEAPATARGKAAPRSLMRELSAALDEEHHLEEADMTDSQADSTFELLAQPEAEVPNPERHDHSEARNGPPQRKPHTRRRCEALAPPAANTRNIATRRPAAVGNVAACAIA